MPVYVCVSVNFNIELMVTQTHTQRMGLDPFSVLTINAMLKFMKMLTHTQTLRVNKA